MRPELRQSARNGRAAARLTALEALVAAERRCCAFLSLRLSEAEDALILNISAPPGAGAVAHALADTFAGTA